MNELNKKIALGYIIAAAKEMNYNEEEISKLSNELMYQFNELDIKRALELYENNNY